MLSTRILGLAHLPGTAATADPRHRDGVTDLRRLFILRETTHARHVSRTHLHVPTMQERDNWHMNNQINDADIKHMKGFSMSDRELHNIFGVGDSALDRSADRFDDITINRVNQYLSYAFPWLRVKSLVSPKLYTDIFGHDSFRDMVNWIMTKQYRDGSNDEMVTLSDYFMRMFDNSDATIAALTAQGGPFATSGGGWSNVFGVWVHGIIYLRLKHAINPSFSPPIHDVFMRVFFMHGIEPSINIDMNVGVAERRHHLMNFCIDPLVLLKHGNEPFLQTEDFIFTRSIGFAPLNCDALDSVRGTDRQRNETFSLTDYRIVPLVRTGFCGNSRVDFPVRLRDDDIMYVFYEGSQASTLRDGMIVDPIISYAEKCVLTAKAKLDNVEPILERVANRLVFRHYDATFQSGMPHVRYRNTAFSAVHGKIGRVNIPDANPLKRIVSSIVRLHYSNSEVTSCLGVEVIKMVRAASRAALNYMKGGKNHRYGGFTVNLNSTIQPLSNVIRHIESMPMKCCLFWKRVLMVYLSLLYDANVPLVLGPIVQSLDPDVLRGTYLDIEHLTDRLMWNLVTNWSFIFLELRPTNFAVAWNTVMMKRDGILVDKFVYRNPPFFAIPCSVTESRELVLTGKPVSKDLTLKITPLMLGIVEDKEFRVADSFNYSDAITYNTRSV